MRTIELGVTISDAAVDEKVTTIFCVPVTRDRAARTAGATAATATPSPGR